MDFRIILILASVCIQLATIASAVDDFIAIYNILQQIAKIYKKYTGRDIDVSPNFVRKLMKPLPFPEPKRLRRTYDFIIVGCGSAGSVLANRLSENPEWNILVLEAGKTENQFSRIPLVVPLLAQTNLAWNYVMEIDPNFGKGVKNQLIGWPRGKALGGSSVINYMVYSRGNPLDYDLWAKQGNPGWSYEDVFPYFLKSESANLKHANSYYHNSDGELSVEEPYISFHLLHTFIKAGAELDYESFADYNSEDQIGFAPSQSTLLNGRRHTTARAFLWPVKTRPNLHVLTEAHVIKILIDERTNQAYGVRYLKDKTEYEVYTEKEIILSSGALNSPKLLMLSGVGPKEDLNELGIPVIQDLPVGKQLYDHVFYYGLNFVLNKPISMTPIKVLNPLALKMYSEFVTGPLSSCGGIEGIAFIKTNLTQNERPDIELQLSSGTLASDFGLFQRVIFGIPTKIFDAYWGPLTKSITFSLFPILTLPKSKGYMKLRSKHPLVAPLFYGNYFSDPEGHDIKTMIEGIRFSIRLIQTEAFRRYGTYLDPTPVPGCERLSFGSDAYWECALRTFSYTQFHMMCTAKMGPNSTDSVVDHNLKVHGIKGLRVADMSVPPMPLTGHLNAQAVMIGEKASDLIKNTWKKRNKKDKKKYYTIYV